MRAREGGLAQGLLFAGVAGLATAPYLLAVVPIAGWTNALGFGAAALVAAYLATIAPTVASGVRIALLAGGLAGTLALVAPGRSSVLLVAAIVLAVLRSGFLYRTRPARALVTEAFLLGGGWTLAGLVGGVGVLDGALAVWGFFLVQSLYGVVGGLQARRSQEQVVDPFVRARDEANRIMEEIQA